MRVIAGKYRGKVLVPIDGNSVRPTSDKVKESIFGSIQFDIAGSVFVDLFAGSGAMGIEALSRGADKVYFVDAARDSIDIIKKNLVKVQVDSEDDYDIVCNDFKVALSSIKGQVDIIFVDAPYKDKPLKAILDVVSKKNLLHDDGKIIYEHLYEDGESQVGENFEVVKRKKYGIIQVEVIKHI